MARAANEGWKAVKSAVASVGARQTLRLELAMGSRRTWSVDELHSVFVEHPLLNPLVRRIIWSHESPDDPTNPVTFRIAEEGSFATAEDGELSLPHEARVRVAHPIRMSESLRAAWGEVLADYEMLQPFDQLGRACHPPTGEPPAVPNGAYVRGSVMRRLVKRGWVHEKKAYRGFGRRFGDLDVRIEVSADPKFYYVRQVQCLDVSSGASVGWADVPAELYTEVCYDFAWMNDQ